MSKDERAAVLLPVEHAEHIAHPYFRDMYERYALAGDADAAEHLKQALMDDVNAWSLFCALMLTISLPAALAALTVNREEYSFMHNLYVLLLCVSSCCSIVAVRISLITAVTVSGVPLELIPHYMRIKFATFEGGYFNFDLVHYR